jgi:RNA polymerase sigma-70 factor (ECF subfamily)
LVKAFVAAGGTRSAEADDALEATLRVLCARGAASQATFGVDDEAFVAHLARCGAPVSESQAVHVEDLYLACACLGRRPEALARLRAELRPVIQRYLRRLNGADAITDEIEQRLWDRLLVGDQPRLATYAGRGPLGAWIGISAQRLALTELQHERAEARARREVAAHGHLADGDPELAIIRERFRPEFQAAVASALETLDDRERVLYRLHVVEGLTFEQLGKTYQVHPVTVSRWLAAASQKVLQRSKEALRKTLPVSSDEFESLARLLARHLDLSISDALKSR